MAIKVIEIEGFRSISNIRMELGSINTFLGENGSGKSNILSAIYYFYQNLLKEQEEDNIFDNNNSLSNRIRIKVVFDLSKILKIVGHNLKKEGTTYEKYYQKVLGISHKDEIVVELLKIKRKPIKWNVDYNERQIIAAIFPIYYIDARKIELTEWNESWNLIGDLIKVGYDESENLQTQIVKIASDTDKALSSKISRLQHILNIRGINVTQLTSKQLGVIIAEIALGGKNFEYKNRRLQDYSNGTNAYNYTILLIDILKIIKEYKVKEPVIILDEPEISLHIGLIDELMEKILFASSEIQFVISTHSSRCMKRMFECDNVNYYIYHAVLKNKYTSVKKIRNLSENDTRERVIVTEAYVNSCFTKLILSVEGATELEVFKNKYLKELFPELKKVELVTGMSNATIQNLISPIQRNFQTSFFSIIDMDKVLERNFDGNTFILKSIKENNVQKENYYYGEKRKKTLYVRKRIERMCKKCRFNYKFPFYSCEDINFKQLLGLIFEYYRTKNVLVWENTIEGALITQTNYKKFLNFVQQMNIISIESRKNIGEYLERWGMSMQLNYIRIVFSGKSDFLLNKKGIESHNKGIEKELLNTLNTVAKTSGWVSKWIEYYILCCAGIKIEDQNNFLQFKKYIENEINKEFLLNRFQRDFFELHRILTIVKEEYEKLKEE